MKEKIEVGRKVYLKPVRNAARGGNKAIIETEIVKVGRKYFEVDRGIERKYKIDTLELVSKYSPDYELYFSKQEILDEYEYENLFSKIQSKFAYWVKMDLTLDQLRRIVKIITE